LSLAGQLESNAGVVERQVSLLVYDVLADFLDQVLALRAREVGEEIDAIPEISHFGIHGTAGAYFKHKFAGLVFGQGGGDDAVSAGLGDFVDDGSVEAAAALVVGIKLGAVGVFEEEISVKLRIAAIALVDAVGFPLVQLDAEDLVVAIERF